MLGHRVTLNVIRFIRRSLVPWRIARGPAARTAVRGAHGLHRAGRRPRVLPAIALIANSPTDGGRGRADAGAKRGKEAAFRAAYAAHGARGHARLLSLRRVVRTDRIAIVEVLTDSVRVDRFALASAALRRGALAAVRIGHAARVAIRAPRRAPVGARRAIAARCPRGRIAPRTAAPAAGRRQQRRLAAVGIGRCRVAVGVPGDASAVRACNGCVRDALSANAVGGVAACRAADRAVRGRNRRLATIGVGGSRVAVRVARGAARIDTRRAGAPCVDAVDHVANVSTGAAVGNGVGRAARRWSGVARVGSLRPVLFFRIVASRLALHSTVVGVVHLGDARVRRTSEILKAPDVGAAGREVERDEPDHARGDASARLVRDEGRSATATVHLRRAYNMRTSWLLPESTRNPRRRRYLSSAHARSRPRARVALDAFANLEDEHPAHLDRVERPGSPRPRRRSVSGPAGRSRRRPGARPSARSCLGCRAVSARWQRGPSRGARRDRRAPGAGVPAPGQ